MSEINNKSHIQIEPDKMQSDINELQSKFDNLSKEVNYLEKSKTDLGSDLQKIHEEFEQINKNIEEILEKINKLSGEYCEIGTEMDEKKTKTHSMKNFFTNSFRKIAVGTLTTVYAVADKTMEKTSGFKESFEDVAAEAQYNHKKKRSPAAETS